MRRGHAIVAGCLLVTSLVSATTASPAAGPPPRKAGAVGKPPLEMLKAMQRDLRLTQLQVQSRLLNEVRLTPIAARLRGRLDTRFAGSWFVGPVSGTLMVATTSPGDVSQIIAMGARPRVVGRSLAELEETKKRLDQALSGDPQVSPVRYLDVRTNTVVALSENPAVAERAITTAGISSAAVRVIASTERPRLLRRDPMGDLVGGQGYYIGAVTHCSVGFSVTHTDRTGAEQKGFVSAGHCGRPGDGTVGFNGLPQGTVQASAFPVDDFSWIAVNDNWRPRPLVGDDSGGTMRIRGAKQAIEGASVCLAGSSASGLSWHCGTIRQRDADVVYPEGYVGHLTRTNVCGNAGDSGGAFLSIDQAQGVASGGSGDCAGGGVTYFQPINEILTTYDLVLVTNDVTPMASTGTCGGYPHTFTGTLKNAQSAYQPGNRYYSTTITGDHYSCLESKPGVDFDLYLQKRVGSAWSTVAVSDGLSPVEELGYRGTPGDYRYRVLSASGSASYRLGYLAP